MTWEAFSCMIEFATLLFGVSAFIITYLKQK